MPAGLNTEPAFSTFHLQSLLNVSYIKCVGHHSGLAEVIESKKDNRIEPALKG
jgi:hypothetical protein